MVPQVTTLKNRIITYFHSAEEKANVNEVESWSILLLQIKESEEYNFT